MSTPTPQYRFAWRGDFTNDSLNVLHPEAFGHAVLDYDWLAQVRGHSPGWVCAWATSLPWVPFQGPLELVVSVPDPQATIGSLALGIAGGLVVAVLAEQDYVRVTVEDDQLTLFQRWLRVPSAVE